MDANKIIDNLLERIKQLTKENAFLTAHLETIEEDMKNAVPEAGETND